MNLRAKIENLKMYTVNQGEFEDWNEDPELDESNIKWFYLIHNEDIIKRLRSIEWESPYEVSPFLQIHKQP